MWPTGILRCRFFQKQQLRKIKSVQVSAQDAFFHLISGFRKHPKVSTYLIKRASWCQKRHLSILKSWSPWLRVQKVWLKAAGKWLYSSLHAAFFWLHLVWRVLFYIVRKVPKLYSYSLGNARAKISLTKFIFLRHQGHLYNVYISVYSVYYYRALTTFTKRKVSYSAIYSLFVANRFSLYFSTLATDCFLFVCFIWLYPSGFNYVFFLHMRGSLERIKILNLKSSSPSWKWHASCWKFCGSEASSNRF